MRMKKITAKSMPDAMTKVRAELGEDAVILNSKVVYTNGILGLFKKKQIEVVAGLEEVSVLQSSKLNAEKPVSHPVTTSVSPELKQELSELKNMMKELKRPHVSHFPDDIESQLNYLRNQDVNEELVTEIGDELFEHKKATGEVLDAPTFLSITSRVLKEKLQDLPFGGLSYRKKYINILGPTGVGKTTTIAKMAARAVLEKKKKIGFITTDTYRIAAIEQLKTYANLLQAPVEVVYNKEDFEQANRNYLDVDLVFIDTAGRNYLESKFVEEMKNLLHFNDSVASFLVLSSTSKERDMRAIIEQFSTIPIDQFIMTKVDETSSIGAIINILIEQQKGLAYLTDGQEVPEDITEATVDGLIKMLLKEYSYA
ncbi:flagellar biosynthesis protein FlhF [Paenisporosarcina cavernae]|uniref:Flagellar biosynthesis protein FlhF n=1 Tax=Paenisporosarcina cavernae TaxID=2320858 RepID=A0A385YUA1_9BACL|nr:flagellar biosynthesis protein FlhF [Paenisporosarcina cavernae]AYC29258.1 flagellar biosynthesis protein FlhF [Paenisporosarcina cavernae]